MKRREFMDRTWVEDAKEAGERFPFVL